MIIDELFIESSTEWKIKVLELLIRRGQPAHQDQLHNI